MDLTSHALTERFVDELVPGETALTGKFTRHHARGEMRVVVRFDPHLCPGEGRADELCDLFRIHAREY
jgi:hypothetical protein